MADIGSGYGSECHLLRYLGRHRAELDRRVLDVVGGDAVSWIDFWFDSASSLGDGERKGLDFLAPADPLREAWSNYWPTSGQPPNWDAVGIISRGGDQEWLLVEAKANIPELRSSCQARVEGGRSKIERAFAEVKKALGVDPSADWLSGYYQSANRIAVLHFLLSMGTPARLLFIYFTGDRNPSGHCPADQDGWASALEKQDRHLGVGASPPERLHKLFLDARPGRIRPRGQAEAAT